MVWTVTSPYGDDETRSKEISKILEEFIEDEWDETKTTVPVTNVAFGVHGNKILQSGKDITLRGYSIAENVQNITVDGGRKRYDETIIMDIYVLNNELNNSRDPRAIAIRKWLDGLFSIWQGRMVKGIYEMDYRGARIDNDVETNNLTRVKATVIVTYIMDVVEV